MLPQLEQAVLKEGRATRESIIESTGTIIQHLDKVVKRLDVTESLVRIKAEILPTSSNQLGWYDETNAGIKPDFKLWCLDQASGEEHLEPCALYEGLELSSFRLNCGLDNLLTELNTAEEVDGAVRVSKSHSASNVSPYVGLAKRGDSLHQLHEYIPLFLKESFHQIPRAVQKDVMRVARALSQEYRYMILDRIIKEKAYTLPKLHLLENMERAMLALHAEKLKVTLGLFLDQALDDGPPLLYQLRIQTSRYSDRSNIERFVC